MSSIINVCRAWKRVLVHLKKHHPELEGATVELIKRKHKNVKIGVERRKKRGTTRRKDSKTKAECGKSRGETRSRRLGNRPERGNARTGYEEQAECGKKRGRTRQKDVKNKAERGKRRGERDRRMRRLSQNEVRREEKQDRGR